MITLGILCFVVIILLALTVSAYEHHRARKRKRLLDFDRALFRRFPRAGL
jgi:hypothetical protein